MTTTRIQLLGWLEHCEREHPGKGTNIPTWLCSMDVLHEAENEDYVQKIGTQPMGARHGSMIIYGLTDKGRTEFYQSLSRAGEEAIEEIFGNQTLGEMRMSSRTTIERIRGSAAVALECLKSAHTEKDARRYMQQVLDMIDIAVSLKEFEPTPDMRVLSADQIKHMVNRFLGWKLPKNFSPDDGISFDPIMNKGHEFESRREPTGTNLFDADQAEGMVRYMTDGMLVANT